MPRGKDWIFRSNKTVFWGSLRNDQFEIYGPEDYCPLLDRAIDAENNNESEAAEARESSSSGTSELSSVPEELLISEPESSTEVLQNHVLDELLTPPLSPDSDLEHSDRSAKIAISSSVTGPRILPLSTEKLEDSDDIAPLKMDQPFSSSNPELDEGQGCSKDFASKGERIVLTAGIPKLVDYDISSDEEEDDSVMLQACLRGETGLLGKHDIFSNGSEDESDEIENVDNLDYENIASTEPSVNSAESSINESSLPAVDMQMRDYQRALFEIAKKENIIACLPTGSGKTLIAVKLMNHFEQSVKEGKKILFLANTVPLLQQQAQVIKDHTTFKVQVVHGGNKNQWQQWESIKSSFDVFVMIPTIFMHMVDHSYLSFEDLALLVIDECHHALKSNPISVMMDRYKELKRTEEGTKLPRVLGLSATILKQNVNVDCVEMAIHTVEDKLSCKAITYELFESVLKHSTNAELVVLNYTCSLRVEYADVQFEIVFLELKEFLSYQLSVVSDFVLANEPSLGMMEKFDRIKKEQRVFNDMSNSIEDIKHVLAQVGPYGAMKAALVKLEYFTTLIPTVVFKQHYKHYYLTVLRTFMFRIRSYLDKFPSELKVLKGSSNKVMVLLQTLRNLHKVEKDLCGIVFATRRIEVLSLLSVLEELSVNSPETWGFLKPAVVLGVNNDHSTPSEYRQSASKQAEVLRKFRNGQVNVIIATSVLEEGIDVQACSFVARFDKIQSYPSFHQSMGRARKQNSKYYVMLSDEPEESARGAALIDSFQTLKSKINETLKGQMALIREAVEKGMAEEDDSEVPKVNTRRTIQTSENVFCPGGKPDSPRITLYTAISTVNKYTSLLRGKDGGGGLNHPVSLTKAVSELGDDIIDPEVRSYYTVVQLPKNAAVPELVTGPLQTGSKNAKRAAFLLVCKKLYAAGVFDEKLNPRPISSTT